MTGIIAYRLQPLKETPPGGLATAAVMSCAATGEMLSGMGGGGLFLSPRIVDALRTPGAKAIIDQKDLDALIEIARAAARDDLDDDVMRLAGETLAGMDTD